MSESVRPYSEILKRLREAGLRPTRQRLALAKLLFTGNDRHVSAEMLREEATKAGVRVSFATIYNTLNQFTAVGLLRAVHVSSEKTYFDTNTREHHHFFFEESEQLQDIAPEDVVIAALPPAPEGKTISQVSLVIRVSDKING